MVNCIVIVLRLHFYICSRKYDDGTRFIPIVGSPLPIMSYGGSSMMAIMFGLGIVMSVRYIKMFLSTKLKPNDQILKKNFIKS